MESIDISSKRKQDHIRLAIDSVTEQQDARFNYEPILGALPSFPEEKLYSFLGFKLLAPIWISSMTGGTVQAQAINHILAKTAHKYGLGMGLGSCRGLLYSKERWADFNLKPILGDQPLLANFGIAQVEELINDKSLDLIFEVVKGLNADGLIIHVNPLQEWMQAEGDQIKTSPLKTIKTVRDKFKGKLIIKEVGQGMGPKSLESLMKIGVDGIEFGAFGGTNFSRLELLRDSKNCSFQSLIHVGHTAGEMLEYCNSLAKNYPDVELIVSGGIKGFLDGFYYCSKSKLPAVYGQAGAFLKAAQNGQDSINDYVESQIMGWEICKSLLSIRENV